MPRRRFSTPRSRKSRQPKADWVYRGPLLQLGSAEGSLLDTQATYDNSLVSLTPNPINAIGQVLYDSHNYFADFGRGGVYPVGQSPGILGRPARAEGQRATILRSEGVLIVTPASAWTLSSYFSLGIRIGAFEQSKVGAFSIDPAYSMWSPSSVAPFEQLNEWANFRRANRKEWRFTKGYTATGGEQWSYYLSWRGRARLDPHDCWGLYLETEGGSIPLFVQFWWRSLVIDDD